MDSHQYHELLRTQPRRRRQPERVVAITLAEHLTLRAGPDIWWAHYPAGGRRHPTEAAIFKEMGVKAGTPDLLIAARGRMYGLELKAIGGRLSPEQIITHENMRRAGVVVGTAAGIDEALAMLSEWGILP